MSNPREVLIACAKCRMMKSLPMDTWRKITKNHIEDYHVLHCHTCEKEQFFELLPCYLK